MLLKFRGNLLNCTRSPTIIWLQNQIGYLNTKIYGRIFLQNDVKHPPDYICHVPEEEGILITMYI
jgi:hypothetical protein